MPFDQSILKPGDCLLYAPTGFFGFLITVKGWHKVGHCEAYIGDGYSVASRNGKGVAAYPFREKDLITVLRPNREFKLNTALSWFITEAKGQKYDWLGLLRFTWGSDYSKGNENNKQFCSEFLCRFYRQGGLDICNQCDADSIMPFQFGICPLFDVIWRKS